MFADNDRNTKLMWLKNLRKHLKLPSGLDEVWIWMDIFSIPQRASNAESQALAIKSLPCYSQLCSRFLPIVRDPREWHRLYGEDLFASSCSPHGAFATYITRGWCRLEMVTALAPKKLSTGAWRPGPRNVRFRFHQDPDAPGIGPLVHAAFLSDPRLGNFSNVLDIDRIEPVLCEVAKRYAEYAASGSDVWDATIDVHGRPDWLKELAGVDPKVREAPEPDIPTIGQPPSLLGQYSRSSLFGDENDDLTVDIEIPIEVQPPANDTSGGL